MTSEQLKDVYDATPLRPFYLHIADGRSIPVHQRDFMLTAPKGRTIVVAEPNGRFHILDLLMVTELELMPVAGNGARKRRRGS
ncbi:MAG: hypothetical protein ACREHD_26010 [Pirellulales bacterium]